MVFRVEDGTISTIRSVEHPDEESQVCGFVFEGIFILIYQYILVFILSLARLDIEHFFGFYEKSFDSTNML